MKAISKPLADFQLTEKSLIDERRFGLIARLCQKVLQLQRKHKRDLSIVLDDKKTRNGMISFNVWEMDGHIGINKGTLQLAVIHVDKNNNPDGFIHKGKVIKERAPRRNIKERG